MRHQTFAFINQIRVRKTESESWYTLVPSAPAGEFKAVREFTFNKKNGFEEVHIQFLLLLVFPFQSIPIGLQRFAFLSCTEFSASLHATFVLPTGHHGRMHVDHTDGAKRPKFSHLYLLARGERETLHDNVVAPIKYTRSVLEEIHCIYALYEPTDAEECIHDESYKSMDI